MGTSDKMGTISLPSVNWYPFIVPEDIVLIALSCNYVLMDAISITLDLYSLSL